MREKHTLINNNTRAWNFDGKKYIPYQTKRA